MLEGLSGSSGPGMQREKRGERGRPQTFLVTGKRGQPHEGTLRMQGESDHLVVRGGRESRSQGAGGDGGPEPSQETWAGHAGPEATSQPP